MKPNYKKCEQLAEQLLEKYHITEPIVNIFDIAKNEGLDLHFVYMPEKLKNAAGFLDKENKCIYVNKSDSPHRQFFTIAHELGHYMLGHQPSEYRVLMRFILPGGEYDAVEQEANCFAGNVLVPTKMLVATMKQYRLDKEDADLLAKLFGVSKDTIKYRLQELHLWQKQPT